MTAEDRQSDWNPADATLSVPERLAQMAAMRAKCPVAYTDHLGGQWSVLRYADIVKVTGDIETFGNLSRRPRWGEALPPVEADPPLHTEYRRLLQKFFTPPRIAALEPRMRKASIDLLTPIIARRHGDLALEFSYPLPVLALCALLGIPETDWATIKKLAETTLLIDSESEEERAQAKRDHEAILDYAQAMVADRQKHPRNPDTDIPTAILQADIEGKGVEKCAAILRLMIAAGHNSTTSAIGNAMLHLASHGDDQERLRRDPKLIPTAVEEFLRFDTPVQEMPRYARRDAELHGRQIQEGDKLGLFFGAANRDEAAFPEPDRCIIDRKPNRHLAFGSGIHTCLGAPLARMEARVALEELLGRTKSFSITGEVVRPRYHRMGVTSLPVAIEA
jgi:cytochrome P450